MRSKLLLAGTLVLAIAPACATAQGESEHDHATRTHNVVTITQMAVHPPVAQIGQDEVVVWVNYTQDYNIHIMFPEAVADSLECALRPSFYRTGSGTIVSRPFGPMEFAMPCKLKPGEYSYTVIGVGADASGGLLLQDTAQPGDPTGKIVVK